MSCALSQSLEAKARAYYHYWFCGSETQWQGTMAERESALGTCVLKVTQILETRMPVPQSMKQRIMIDAASKQALAAGCVKLTWRTAPAVGTTQVFIDK